MSNRWRALATRTATVSGTRASGVEYTCVAMHPHRALLSLALLAGCPSVDGPADADIHIVLLDRGPETISPDLFRDLGTDAPDATVFLDGPPDVGPPSDATPTLATALYAVTSNVDSFGLRTVATDGSGSPTPVAGWSGFIDLEPLRLTGLDEDPPVNRQVPHVTAAAHPQFRGVQLPGLGTLYYFHRKLMGDSGLLLVRPDGGLQVLLEVPGLYSDTLSDHVALAPDGKIGAVVQGKDKPLLFRTDGGTFSSGKSWLPVAKPAGLTQVRPESLTISGSWLYCVGQGVVGDQLYRAPLDGSAPLAPITLPPSGGAPPVSIASQLLLGGGGKRLAVAAGATSAQRDLYLIDDASGQATNITKSPGQVAPPGDHFGQPSGGLMAISPGGKLVAFVRTDQGSPELHVAKGDGSGAVHVTTDARFESSVAVIINLHFADDNNLLFMAGVTMYQMDLFRWDQAQATAANVTGHGSSVQPFAGYGTFYPRAAWVSPNGKFLYWVEYDYSVEVSDLRGLDLGTLKLQKVTTNAELPAGADSFAACPTSGKLYFVAEPNPKQNNREVWEMDQNSGGPAVKRTTMSTTSTSYWFVYNLTTSVDCSRLSWSAGGTYAMRHLYALDAQTGPPVTVTLVPKYVEPTHALTPDGLTHLFASGGSDGSATLKAVASAHGATPLTLDPVAGAVHIFAVY